MNEASNYKAEQKFSNYCLEKDILKILDNIELKEVKFKQVINQRTNDRVLTFSKEKLIDFILMQDEQIEQIVELGVVTPKGRNKQYPIRRVGDYTFAGYNCDPVKNKRILANSLQRKEVKSSSDPNILSRISGLMTMCCFASLNPAFYFESSVDFIGKLSHVVALEDFISSLSNHNSFSITLTPKQIENLIYQKQTTNNDNKVENKCINEDNKCSFILPHFNSFSPSLKEDELCSPNPYTVFPLALVHALSALDPPPVFNAEMPEEIPRKSNLYKSILNLKPNQKVKYLKSMKNKIFEMYFESLVHLYQECEIEWVLYMVEDENCIKEISKIQDMSHLMVFMTRYSCEKVALPLEKRKKGVCIIAKAIKFEDEGVNRIPAILPYYYYA